MKNIVIFGATSAIAKSTAELYAKEGAHLLLVGRNAEQLSLIAKDLKIKGAAETKTIVQDLSELDSIPNLISQVKVQLANIDVALIAHGTLPVQEKCEQSLEETLRQITTNGLSAVALLQQLSPIFEQQKSGTIACITSVAGDRGRQSNYTYGAAKSLVSTYLQGMTQKLSKVGVNIIDIKPGFVDTPMTAEFKKGLLWAQPELIALYIKKKDHDQGVIYTPSFWYIIMKIIKTIPNRLFNKIKL